MYLWRRQALRQPEGHSQLRALAKTITLGLHRAQCGGELLECPRATRIEIACPPHERIPRGDYDLTCVGLVACRVSRVGLRRERVCDPAFVTKRHPLPSTGLADDEGIRRREVVTQMGRAYGITLLVNRADNSDVQPRKGPESCRRDERRERTLGIDCATAKKQIALFAH